MRFRIRDIRFVFVFENIQICIRIRICGKKVLFEFDSMRIQSVSILTAASFCLPLTLGKITSAMIERQKQHALLQFVGAMIPRLQILGD
jgi:hypothetical protein